MKSVAKLALVVVVCLINFVAPINLGALLKDKDIVALWLFDENDGKVVRDSSASRNDGKIVGAKWTVGNFKAALSFLDNAKVDKPGDKGVYVEVPSSNTLNVAGDQITVQAWVKPQEIHLRDTCLNSIAQKWGDVSGRRQYQLTLCGKAGGVAWFYVSTDGSNHPRVEGVTPIELNKWTHISGTYDGKHLKIYVNGVLDAEVEQNGDLHTSDIYVRLGGYGFDKEQPRNRFFFGDLDEVMIAKKALTPAEIEQTITGLLAVDPALKVTTTWGRIKNQQQ